MKIFIIPGHRNVQYNSITSLHGNTGTAGELEINIRIADRVSAMLRERGFEVVQSDANANDDKTITSQDFALALALHCDMDIQGDQGGGMVGSGDASVDDSWQESLRIKKVFDGLYFKETGIVNKNFVTEGMAKYYIWQYLSSKTPCVLIEMGQAKDPHDSVLLGNTELIASAIVRSICKAFNVPYDVVPVQPPEPSVDYQKLLDEKNKQVNDLRADVKKLQSQLDIATQVTDTQTKQIDTLKRQVINLQEKLDTSSIDSMNTASLFWEWIKRSIGVSRPGV